MCCGQTAADVAGMFDEQEAARTAPIGGGMAKVWSTRLGAALRVGSGSEAYGVASNDAPCQVPAEVGRELAALIEDDAPVFRVEFEDGEPATLPDEGVEMAQDEPEFHAEGGKVYHDSPACTTGNDIEPGNRRTGKGRLRRCDQCKALAKASTGE